MKPHQFSGGGYWTFCLLRSSCGMLVSPGARVGRGDTPVEAMRPFGVGSGMATTILNNSDACRRAIGKAIL